MCKLSKPTRCERRVRFSPVTEDVAERTSPKRDNDRQGQDQDQVLPQQPELTKRERKGLLWYSKRELAESRRDVKRTIIAIYEQGGIDLLHHSTYFDQQLQEQDHNGGDQDTNTDQQQQQLVSEQRDQLCIRGCERYYSSSGRSQVVQDFRTAVLEAQNHMPRGQPNTNCLGQISNILSQSNKELAAWYAKLNAADCWGHEQQLAKEEQQQELQLPQQERKEQPPLEQSPSQSQSLLVKITVTMASSSPATDTGYRMAADGANKENRLWRRSR
jgi:hypothetical protein